MTEPSVLPDTADDIATVTLNRPQVLNALDLPMAVPAIRHARKSVSRLPWMSMPREFRAG